MANKIGQLYWEITGDDSKLDKSLKNVDGKIKKTGESTSVLGNLFKSVIGIGAVAAIGKLIKANVDAASVAEETGNKFNVVFDSVIDNANKLASELSKNYNIASTESKSLLSNTGDLLVGFGVAKDTALDLSFQVQALAADLASFNDLDVTSSSKALTAALFGETEAAKGLGLALGETQLREYAEEQGKVFKELSLNEKAFLRLELAYSQSDSAIGSLSKRTNTYAFQLRRAERIQKDFSEAQGKKFLPIATAAITAYNDLTEAGFEYQKRLESLISEGIDGLSDLAGQLSKVSKVASEAFSGTFDEALTQINSGIASLKSSVSVLASELGELGSSVTDYVSELLNFDEATTDSSSSLGVLASITQTATIVFKGLSLSIAGGINAIRNLGSAIVDSARVFGAFNKAIAGVGSWDQLDKAISVAKGSFKKFGNDAVADTKKLYSEINKEVDNFGKGQDKLKEKFRQALIETQDQVEKTTKKSTIAQVEQNTKVSDLFKEYQKLISSQSEFAKSFGDTSFEAFKSFTKWKKEVQDFALVFNTFGTGATDIIGAVDRLQQQSSNNQLRRLDRQLQAELEASGVAEETALQAAQRELELAEESGSEEDKQAAKRAVKRAEIEEKFEKKKAEIQYQSALTSWQLQRAMALIQLAQAPLNAYVSTLATPIIGPVLAPINAGIAAGVAALQFAQVEQTRPEKPSFQYGGVVPGSSYSGDNVSINANSKEMVITQQQQSKLLNIANGGQSGSDNLRPVIIDDDAMFNMLFAASKDGRLFISDRAVVSR